MLPFSRRKPGDPGSEPAFACQLDNWRAPRKFVLHGHPLERGEGPDYVLIALTDVDGGGPAISINTRQELMAAGPHYTFDVAG